MAKQKERSVEQKLDSVIDLLQHLLVLELSQRGVSQEDIGKHLKVAKSTVGKKLRGVKAAEKK